MDLVIDRPESQPNVKKFRSENGSHAPSRKKEKTTGGVVQRCIHRFVQSKDSQKVVPDSCNAATRPMQKLLEDLAKKNQRTGRVHQKCDPLAGDGGGRVGSEKLSDG